MGKTMLYVNRFIYDDQSNFPVNQTRSLFYDGKTFSNTYMATDQWLTEIGVPQDIHHEIMLYMAPMWACTSRITVSFTEQWISFEYHTDSEKNSVRIVEKRLIRKRIVPEVTIPVMKRPTLSQRFCDFVKKIL